MENFTEFKKKHQVLIETLDYNGIGVCVIDQNYKILYYSSILEENFGIHHRKKCYEYFLQRNTPCEICPMQRSIKNNKIEQEILFTPDNRTYKTISAPLLNDNGKLDRALEIVIDITEEIEHKMLIRESEEIFRAITQETSIGIAIIQENRVKYANRTVEKIFGFTVNEILSWDPDQFPSTVHPEYREFIAEQVEKKQNGIMNYVNQYQFKGIKKSGETLWLENHTKSIIYKGKPADLVMLLDITEKKNAELKLKESEEELKESELLLQKSQKIAQIGSFEMNLSTNDVVWSNQLYKLFGLKKEGKFVNYEKVLALIHPDDRERAIKVSSDAVKERRSYSLEHRVIHPNGKILNFLITGDVTLNEKNEVIKIGGITQDITERKKAEQKLKKSETKLKGIMNSITDQVCVLDRNFNILYINSIVEEIYGPSALGSKCYQVYHGLDQPCSDCQVRRTFEDSEVHNNECLRIIGEESQCCWCVSNVFERDEEGRPISVVEVSRDITERKKIEQKLKDSEEKYRLLFENSPIGIGLSTFEGKILDQNDAMSKLTGYTLEELNKIGIPSAYADPNERLKIMDLLKETREVHDYEVKLRRKDNSEIHASLSLDLIEFEGKKIIQSALRDVTEEKKAELELIKINELKSELLTRTSHELKTPLVSIKGYIYLLLKKFSKTLGVEELTLINEIEKASLRLETLIHNILQNAEFESGKREIKKYQNDLASLIHNCVRELKVFAGLRDLTINLNIYEELIIQFDREQIYQAINIILSNAIKYTEPNGVIEINSKITEDFIEITIQDSGIGFTEEEKERLFTQFGKIERYGQGFDVISEGIGLGLHIAKKIIDLHGGEIWVESEGKYRGSTFSFSLPRYAN